MFDVVCIFSDAQFRKDSPQDFQEAEQGVYFREKMILSKP